MAGSIPFTNLKDHHLTTQILVVGLLWTLEGWQDTGLVLMLTHFWWGAVGHNSSSLRTNRTKVGETKPTEVNVIKHTLPCCEDQSSSVTNIAWGTVANARSLNSQVVIMLSPIGKAISPVGHGRSMGSQEKA